MGGLVAVHRGWFECGCLAADWPSTGGNPQRDGWSQGETIFSKASVPKVKLLWKYKVDNKAAGAGALTSPIVLSRPDRLPRL